MKVELPTTLIAAAVLVLTGCAGNTVSGSKPKAAPLTTTASAPAPTTPLAGDATASAKKIQALVSSVVKVVPITKSNDPNPIFGRPGSYVSAAVVYEKTLTCTTLTVACGAKVEVYKSAADATARAKYLSGMKRDRLIPGGEYDYLRGVAVLRVFGGLTPLLAEKYHAAFGGRLA